MKKSAFLAAAAMLALASFKAPAAFAFTTDTGADPVVSSGIPHLTDPDEQTPGGFELGFGGASAEPSSYFATGGGGVSSAKTPDSATYRSGFSIEPDKSAGNTARKMPQQ